MRKFIIVSVLCLSFLNGVAVNKIDVFDFISQFDWSQTKKEIEHKYRDYINTEELSTGNSIILDSIVLGDYNLSFSIVFDQRDMPSIFSFSPKVDLFFLVEHEKVASVIDSIIYEKFGEPNVPYESIPSFMLENENSIGVKMWKDVKNLQNMSLSQSTLHFNDVFVAYFMLSLLTPIKTEPDFRKGYWGDSRRVIMEREGKRDELGLDNIYSFSTTVAGLGCIAGYRFTNDKLTSAKYLFKNASVYSCINDYEKLFSLLTKKYGDPVENKEENQASERQKDIYTEGELVRDGRLSKSALFLSPFSYIFISLSGGDGFSLIIEYYSIEHDNEIEKDILMDL